MIATGIGTDGRMTLRVPYRRRLDKVWLIAMGLLALNVAIMHDPDATWPNGRLIHEVIRVPWLWTCVAIMTWLVLAQALRLLATAPALRIAEGRVLVYAVPYRWFRFRLQDVISISEVMDARKGSNSEWLHGRRWFAIDYGGVTLAAIGSANIHDDIDEVHRQVVALAEVGPTPMTDPPPWEPYGDDPTR